MTTYRRFCCNDLLRFGLLALPSRAAEHPMEFYMRHLAEWPGNCNVADTAGGIIIGYIFGSVEGLGAERAGQWTEYSVPKGRPLDLTQNLSKLLEDSCEKLYNAYVVKTIVYPDAHGAISEFFNLDYKNFIIHPNNTMELRKPLPRLMRIIEEEK